MKTEKTREEKKGVFFTVLSDGTVTDKGIADELLGDEEHELRMRQMLIDAGVIQEIRTTKIKRNNAEE